MRIRRLAPELMDDPSLDASSHREALVGLDRIHLASRSTSCLIPVMRRVLPEGADPGRLLDVACGGGRLGLELARRSRASGRAMEVTGCDRSPVALARARELARAQGIAARYLELDVLRDPLPGEHDVVLCSLFLHHLREEEAVDLLRRMAAVTARLLLVTDLLRTRAGRLLARTVPRLLTRSRVVHEDAVTSVEASFTRQEMARLADRAGLAGHRIRRRFPGWAVLEWRRHA